MIDNIKVIIQKINKLKVKAKPVLVAVDGRSGSGKTTFSNLLNENLADSRVIHLDKFDLYQGQPSFNIVIDQVLKPEIKNDISNGILIIEGVFALSESLRNYYDFKIWIDYPREQGFERGLKRDIASNGIDNAEKWITYWLPKEDLYIEQEKPQDCADYLVSNVLN